MSRPVVAWSPSSFGQADDAPLRLLEGAGVTVKPNPFGRRLTEDEAKEHLAGVEGLIAGLEPLTREVLESASGLKAIARVGIGVDNIDHEAARELGIEISNTPDAPAESVAELTVSAALWLLRGIGPANQALHEREWAKAISPGLKGNTVLLVGFGRIGRAVYERLVPFGARILVCDPALDEPPVPGVSLVSLEEGLALAGVVSLHAGGRDQIIGAEELRRLPQGAVLLNSARGELVDEGALVEALTTGHLAGAWFDVFWEEPYTGPLCDFDQVLLTPHVGTYTASCRREMEMGATRNLLGALGISPNGG